MRRHKSAFTGFLFILPSLGGVSIFVLVPFMDVIRRSFHSAVAEEWTGLANYRMLMVSSAFRLAAVNTLKFEAVCIPVLILLSLIIGVVLQKQQVFGSILKSAFLVPMAIPVASVVLLWRVLFDTQGLLNGLLARFHYSAVDWMNSNFAFWVLTFSYIWKNLGYDIVLWMAGLSGIPDSLYEAAKVDGADSFKCFIHITIPNLKSTLYTITVLSFLNSFKVFRESYLAAGNYPHESMYLLQNLFQNWFRDMDFDKLAAAAVLMVLVLLILVRFLQRAWDREE